MNDKMDAQIVSWLEEMSDFEDASLQLVDGNVSDSDRSTYYSEHTMDAEQSADSDDSVKAEPPLIYVSSKIPPIRGQCISTLERSRSRSPATVILDQPRSRRRKRTRQPGDTSPSWSSDDDVALVQRVRRGKLFHRCMQVHQLNHFYPYNLLLKDDQLEFRCTKVQMALNG